MQPFEASPAELEAELDSFIDVVFADLASEFLTMPRGEGFVEYPVFSEAYEHLKQVTRSFSQLRSDVLFTHLIEFPLGFIVLRSILGFTPSEWAYVATERLGKVITQEFARSFDREIRLAPHLPIHPSGKKETKLRAMVEAACALIQAKAPTTPPNFLHRLSKADTAAGLESIRHFAEMGSPYSMLLYERFLGRPFAGHRDSVSELVGDFLESAIEVALTNAQLSFRKTKRAERLPGFDQAPDFIIPDEFNPRVVIEAKITEDDGTARDKVTRVQHLAQIGRQRGFQLIACIGGRGFKVRREDMRKLLVATQGKVFTARTLDKLVANSALHTFVPR